MSKYCLSDIADFISEKVDFSSIELEEYISTDNMLPDFNGITLSSVEPSLNKCTKFKANDTLFSNIRTYFKKVWFADFDGGCSPDVIVMRTKNEELVLPEFLYLLICSEDFINFTVMSSNGAKMPRGDKKAMLKYEFEIPSIEEQKIAINHYFKIKEKIQLNTQINQTLEQIAQALFKSWFVDFDPVRAKVQALSDGLSLEQAELAAMQAISGKTPEELTALSQAQPDRYAELAETAKAFPCEMVEVDGVEVPKGWEVKRIDEIANIIKGKSYKSSELEKSKTALVTLKSFNRGGGYRLDGLKEYTGKYKPEQEVFAGELIIAYTDVTQAADVIGKPAMVMSDSNYKHLVISLDVGVVRPFNDVYKHFLYCLAMTDSFQAHTKSFCTGTTVLHLGKDAVPSFEFINPSNKLLHVFYKQTSPIFEKINLHIEENKNLEKVKDLLLSRLLSGEIE
ncbi:restriction endonuclease subunit S [uncultured Aggregatibacter sp.]|uniref:restriction endonuclease subunit S n=1 Tax=uncultured Aggregatibacter sp. TaxID=470564 RepID=UPI0028044053|nr:restriction endonuclease subunit S [uncultured Aggregatibacter sp.]